MTRDSNIPLFLWITTAVLAHLAWGGGATKMSKAIEETLDIKRFALSVQRTVRASAPVEIALLGEEEADKAKPEEPKEDKTDKDDEEEDPDQADEPDKKDDPTKKKEEPKPEPEPEKPKPDTTKPPPKLEIQKDKKDEKAEALKELPKMDPQKRIAVVQHVDDKNQKDNPNAEFIGDEANRVKEQSQARITSTDQNDKNPTPGGAHSGPNKQPGDSDEHKVAQSEDRPGLPNLAPNEPDDKKDKPQKTASNQPPPPPPPPTPAPPQPKAPGEKNGDTHSQRASKDAAQKGQKAQAAQKEVEATPDPVSSPDGSYSMPEGKVAQEAKKARKPRKKRLPPMKGSGGANDLLGLGAVGTTASGVNLNLTPQQAFAAIGRDRLVKERKQDAERRKSAHRGSWQSLGIERWRSAIENYVPSVKPGNQTALNTARVPFASYLNAVHNRLHPIFADSFLASLDSMPNSHPMNRPDIKTFLEIVLSQDDGHVVRMGVTRTSGVTAFDIAALESVQRASPYGAPPHEIVSPDGNVYFHWEFYRNPFYACSTYFAHPFILKGSPKSAPPSVEPPGPFRPVDPREGAPGGGERHGALDLISPYLPAKTASR